MRFESPYLENVPSISGELIRIYSTGQMTLAGKHWSTQRNCVLLSFPLPKLPNALVKIWVSSYGLRYPAVSNVVIIIAIIWVSYYGLRYPAVSNVVIIISIIWVSSYGLRYPAVSNVVIIISIFQLCLLSPQRQRQKHGPECRQLLIREP
jgi:hypothetical protein